MKVIQITATNTTETSETTSWVEYSNKIKVGNRINILKEEGIDPKHLWTITKVYDHTIIDHTQLNRGRDNNI